MKNIIIIFRSGFAVKSGRGKNWFMLFSNATKI